MSINCKICGRTGKQTYKGEKFITVISIRDGKRFNFICFPHNTKTELEKERKNHAIGGLLTFEADFPRYYSNGSNLQSSENGSKITSKPAASTILYEYFLHVIEYCKINGINTYDKLL